MPAFISKFKRYLASKSLPAKFEIARRFCASWIVYDTQFNTFNFIKNRIVINMKPNILLLFFLIPAVAAYRKQSADSLKYANSVVPEETLKFDIRYL